MGDNKKRGIVIIGPLPPPYSGPEINTKNILESAILRERFDLFHLNTQKHSSNSDKGTVSLRNYLLEIKHAFQLFLLILRRRPDIVFLPLSQTDMGFLRDSVFVLISRVFGKKIALYLPGGAYDVFYRRSRIPSFIKFILGISDLIIALSESQRKQIESILGTECNEKMRIVPIDVNIEPSSGKFAREGRENFRVLHMGHISVAKGAWDFVQAIPSVLHEFPNTKFLLAGNFINNERIIDFILDPHGAEGKIKDFIRKNRIEKNVEFLGVVKGGDKTSLLESTDVQVLASYSEGTPRSVHEGMLAGNPVVVTPAGNLAEIVKNGENGFVVDFGRPEEIAARICELLRNRKLRESIGRVNTSFIKKNFSPESRFILLKERFMKILDRS